MTVARTGTVQSHTIIRVPGKAHAADAPFVLLLVSLDDGSRVLGHFCDSEPPRIGTRVVTEGGENETMIFRIAEDKL
jgi:uncharacterized OB-fold protein